MAKHTITLIPGDPDFGLLPKIREQLQAIDHRLAVTTAPAAEDFDRCFLALEDFADMLTQHYFSHSVRRVY